MNQEILVLLPYFMMITDYHDYWHYQLLWTNVIHKTVTNHWGCCHGL